MQQDENKNRVLHQNTTYAGLASDWTSICCVLVLVYAGFSSRVVLMLQNISKCNLKVIAGLLATIV